MKSEASTSRTNGSVLYRKDSNGAEVMVVFSAVNALSLCQPISGKFPFM